MGGSYHNISVGGVARKHPIVMANANGDLPQGINASGDRLY
jgi:hypothetical protein